MKHLIRWQGLVAFVAVVGFFAAIILLFLDTWIRIAIEQGGGRLAGAEINIDSVEHRFSPFGLTLNGVQVTDPQEPTRNRVQLERISAEVALMPLFTNKVIVDELTAIGLEFDQPRENPGRVYDRAAREEADRQSVRDRLAQRGIEIPTADELMASAPLQSREAVEEAEAAFAEHRSAVEQAYEDLPDSDTFDEYRNRLEALRDVDSDDPAALLAAREEFQSIMEGLRAERDRLTGFRERVGEARSELSDSVAELESARERDMELLRGLVAGDAAAFSEVTEAVFGPRVSAWSDRLFSAWDLLAPMLQNRREAEESPQRLEGRWIDFADTQALPDMLVRVAEVSVRWGEESFAIDMRDLTTDHERLGRPSLFSVNSDNTSRWQSLMVDGEFRFTPAGLQASQEWDITGAVLESLTLSEEDRLSATLQSALLNSSGTLGIQDNRLDGEGIINLSALELIAAGDNDLTRRIAQALSSLSNLRINAEIGGLLRSPDLSISSDLDRQLASALVSNIGPEEQARLDELQERLGGITSGTLTESDDLLAQWQDWDGVADNRLGSVREMLDVNFESLVGEGGGLSDRLRGLFGD